MSDYHRPTTTHTAIKVHRCFLCFDPIATGQRYVQQTGFFDGRSYRNRYHEKCWDLTREREAEFEKFIHAKAVAGKNS